ncbi:MAG: glutamyl-tRNA reductase [Sumerlaeia bacterium]
MPLFLHGASHHTASFELLNRMAVAPDAQGTFLRCLGASRGIREAFLLATCNRTEVYLAADSADWAWAAVDGAVRQMNELAPREWRDASYSAIDCAAAAHLFRVACGLDSLVVGESEIVSQIRHAMTRSQAVKSLGSELESLCRSALCISKRVRNRTAIGRGQGSVVSVACAMAGEALAGTLSGKTALVVGAGDTGAQIARAFSRQGAETILLINRHQQRARDLAATLAGPSCVLPWEALAEALACADVAAFATGAPRAVLTSALAAEALRLRGEAPPLALLDLSVPANVAPDVTRLPGVHLYSMADFQRRIARTRTLRNEDRHRAEAMIAASVASWQSRRERPAAARHLGEGAA